MNDPKTEFEFQLDEVRLDGWYSEFLTTVADVDVLELVFGRRGLGYLMMAGIRIESVALDRSDPQGSIVDVLVGDGRIARAPARMLVRRAIEALSEQVVLEGPVPTAPDVDAVRACLGGRFVLLAALHAISLRTLVVSAPEEPILAVEHEGVEFRMPLSMIRSLVADKLEADARALDQVGIDDARVAAAREAAERGDHARVIAALEPMSVSLVSLLRSGAAARMDTPQRETLVEALDLLASAQLASGEAESAETLLRLGAQGCRGERESARLYQRLGEVALARASGGEAIGAFRRALALGARPRDVGPGLAAALASRGRHVAAIAVRDEAIGDGADAALFEALAPSEDRLGEAYAALRRRLGRDA